VAELDATNRMTASRLTVMTLGEEPDNVLTKSRFNSMQVTNPVALIKFYESLGIDFPNDFSFSFRASIASFKDLKEGRKISSLFWI
jgi:hypothetical protein